MLIHWNSKIEHLGSLRHTSKTLWGLEKVNILFFFFVARGWSCGIRDERTTFPRVPPSEAARTDRSLRLLLKQGSGTYRKALRDKHTPLLITPLFIFKSPAATVESAQTENRQEPDPPPQSQKTPFCRRCWRHHLHVSSRLSCPPPLQQCGRQHGSGGPRTRLHAPHTLAI